MARKHFSNIIVISACAAIVGYAIAAYIFQFITGVELSPALTAGWFAFWGTEMAALATIKNYKTKHGSTQPPESEETEDDEP